MKSNNKPCDNCEKTQWQAGRNCDCGTDCESLKNYEKQKAKIKLVYIVHPLRGDVENNRRKVQQICAQLSEEGKVIPISPILTFSTYLPTDGDQTQAMRHCFGLLERCDEVRVYGKYKTSEGSLAEIAFAQCRGIPVFIKGGAGWIELPRRQQSA